MPDMETSNRGSLRDFHCYGIFKNCKNV